jgi:S-adenosylmethionine:tRNA ribosyltransferase-isomerase
MNQIQGSITNPNINDIDYLLPEERIARYPLETRHDSKLLVYKNGSIQDIFFRDIAEWFPTNSLLVFNNTRVIRARMIFRKSTGALVEILCLEPYEPVDYERAFAKTGKGKWKCLVGNLKKWKNEILEKRIEINKHLIVIRARKLGDYRDLQIIEFEWSDERLTFSELLESAGETPIPPYLRRESEPMDHDRYQTVYAHAEGSVAAPTAGLHFTADLLKSIENKGINRLNLTLHVGAGTFRPVLTNSVQGHIMHSEHFSITKENIKSLMQFKGSIIAVGTTSVRTLESLYCCGIKLLLNKESSDRNIHISQWDWIKITERYSAADSLLAVIQYMDKVQISTLHASTQLMILPGYEFKLIDGMITNFHQPKSTLLLLVAALIGDDWKKVYDHALLNDYRFLSYGDSSLLLRPRKMNY